MKPKDKVPTVPEHQETASRILLSPDWLLQFVYDGIAAKTSADEISDLIMYHIDEWMLCNMFDTCDTFLKTVDMERLDTYAIVTIMSSTICAKERLASRNSFIKKAETRLKILAPDRTKGLMKGLY